MADTTGGGRDTLSVDIESLAQSATGVRGHGDDLAESHRAAHTRISSAQDGWVGSSARALSNRSATWNDQNRHLATRVDDHAGGLHSSAEGFSEREAANTEDLRGVADHWVAGIPRAHKCPSVTG